MIKYGVTREMLEHGLPEELWDKIVDEAQQFAANVCQSINNSVDQVFADLKKQELLDEPSGKAEREACLEELAKNN